MRIIKQGDINKTKTVYRGTCPKCGCVFEADPHETEDDQRDQTVYAFCPTCGTGVNVRVK